jgi:hypothetical protein
MSTEWHYTRDGQQLGPVSAAQIKQLAASGQLRPDDLVWKEGMADWSPAARIKGLFTPAPTSATAPGARPVAVGQTFHPAPVEPAPTRPHPGQHYNDSFPSQAQPVSPIGYYNPAAMGTRTATIMKGYAPPTGPGGDWPLSDVHLAQLAAAEKLRKSIRTGAALFNALGFLYAIAGALMLFATLLATNSAPAGRATALIGASMTVLAVFLLALAVLCFLAKSATTKCRIWGTIVFLCLFSIGVLGNLIALAGTAGSRGPDAVEGMIGGGIGLLFMVAFITVTARALSAIPKFRACPVWAQEALINAKL